MTDIVERIRKVLKEASIGNGSKNFDRGLREGWSEGILRTGLYHFGEEKDICPGSTMFEAGFRIGYRLAIQGMPLPNHLESD